MFRLSKFVIILSAALAASSFELGPADVVFHVFTRNNPQMSEALLPVQQSIVTSTQFSIGRPTVLTIHDHRDTVSGNFNAFVIPAHLDAGDVNVVALDYSPGASSYSQATGNAPQVGEVAAVFINILINSFGYQASQVSIVGHGIGAHIAGIAARNINGNVPHIVAIDPPLNGWYYHPDKLGTDAATLVEVLHATIGSYAYDEPLGHFDFYPNGGSVQSGCPDWTCSTQFGFIYYEESVRAEVTTGANKFVGTRCDNWQQAAALACTEESDVYFGGSAAKTGDSGVFLFLTNPLPPYARG